MTASAQHSEREAVTLFVVVPCLDEQEVLPATNAALGALLTRLCSQGLVSEASRVLYVDDGSRDGTWAAIEGFARDPDMRACGVKLAANSGHQNALIAGLATAIESGAQAVVTIDADLQDDEAVIEQMVLQFKAGNDIVYGVRDDRTTDTWFKRTTAQGFYRLMRALGVKEVYNHADYRLMSRRAVEQLLRYGERNLFLRGIVPLLGFKSAQVCYHRRARAAGTPKYPLKKMVNFAIDGITSFSVRPVRLVLALGVVFLFIALAILVYVLYSYIVQRTVAGWTSIILSIWFVGGCILLGLGIVGEYISKIYIEVKNRPRYCVEQKLIH